MRLSKALKMFLAAALLLSLVTAGGGWSSTIKIVHGKQWNESFDQGDLQSGPGSELIPYVETDSAFGRIDIKKTKGSSWEVSITRDEEMWHPNLGLYVRRTASGDNRRVYGGTTYQEISVMERMFFWGTGDSKKIEFQLKVEGISTEIGAEEFTATVTYTLTDTI